MNIEKAIDHMRVIEFNHDTLNAIIQSNESYGLRSVALACFNFGFICGKQDERRKRKGSPEPTA